MNSDEGQKQFDVENVPQKKRTHGGLYCCVPHCGSRQFRDNVSFYRVIRKKDKNPANFMGLFSTSLGKGVTVIVSVHTFQDSKNELAFLCPDFDHLAVDIVIIWTPRRKMGT